MLVSPLPLLKQAKKRRFAIGAFNVYNLESIQAVVNAGEKLLSPVIVQTSQKAIDFAGLDYLVNLVTVAATKASVPVVLHYDHGKDLESIKACIDAGYTSVMVDGSHLSYKENVKLTKKVVQLAHKAGVAVEAEIGTIGGTEDAAKSRKIIYTDPELAKRFVKETGADVLAIAIGTSHGAYKFSGTPKIDVKRLRAISLSVGVPLVLHGASGIDPEVISKANHYGAKIKDAKGVPDDQIKEAIRNGITKINIDTDLRIAWIEAIRETLKKKPRDLDPRLDLEAARKAMQATVEAKIRLFGSKSSI